MSNINSITHHIHDISVALFPRHPQKAKMTFLDKIKLYDCFFSLKGIHTKEYKQLVGKGKAKKSF